MGAFINSLTPLIDESMAEAIDQHVRRMHEDFSLLAALTKDAKNYKEIAQRFVDMGLIDTYQPSDSVINYQNVCAEFVSKVVPLLWMPHRDKNIGMDSHDADTAFWVASVPLQSYLAQQEEE